MFSILRWLRSTAIPCLLAVASTHASAAEAQLRAWYQQPATKWEEAIPLGNGRLGAMMFGGIASEHFQLNESTLYSGYPGYRDVRLSVTNDFATVTNLIAQRKFAEADRLVTEKWLGGAQACYQPLGDLFLDFDHGAKASNYVRELDLGSAVCRVRYEVNGVTFTRELFASHPDEVIALRLTASRPGALDFRAHFTSLHPTAASRADARRSELVMNGRAPGFVLRRELDWVEKKKDTWKYPAAWDEQGRRRAGAKTVLYEGEIGGQGMRFDARLNVRITGGQISAETNALVVAGANETMILLTAATSFNGYDKHPQRDGADEKVKAAAALQAAARRSFAELRERHVNDYRRLFNRVTLDLGDSPDAAKLPTDARLKRNATSNDPGLAALYFQFGRYLMISGSRPGSQPLNLQGIWNPHIIPPWASAYTVNINAEMNYWPAEAANLSECHEPLLRMTRELSVDGSRVARAMYDRPGWVAHHNTTLWRDAQPVDNEARAAFWPLAGGWLCEHLWEHYQFTGDRAFLREVYPVMKGAAEFLNAWLVEDAQGRLVTPVSTSPENAFSYTDASGKKARAAVSAGGTMDLGIIRELFANTAQAAKILGVDDAFRDELTARAKKLLPYQVGSKGQLLEWNEEFQEAEPTHRHVSHLYSLHPANLITLRGTPELAAAAKRTLELRGDGGTGWSKAWKVNFWARLEDGNHAHKMLSELLAKSTMPNLFDTHPPFQIDGNFGGASGIIEMLLQSHAGEIHLLPALPKAWPNGSVKGLRARGGFEVDLTWRDGKLHEAVLHSKLGQTAKVRYGNNVLPIEARAGESRKMNGSLE